MNNSQVLTSNPPVRKKFSFLNYLRTRGFTWWGWVAFAGLVIAFIVISALGKIPKVKK